MYLSVEKTNTLAGELRIPSSKSSTIRAVFVAALAKGESIIDNFLFCEDTEDALRVCKSLGVNFTISASSVKIEGNGHPIVRSEKIIDTGNSGLATHFLIPILGLKKNHDEATILKCGEQMQARPIYPLIDSLATLGLNIHYLKNEQQLPISVEGKLTGGPTVVSGITSQYLSALLLSLPLACHDSVIMVEDLKEQPYLDMTLRWLDFQEINYSFGSESNRKNFYIKGNQSYKPFTKEIEGDYSSASYFMAAAALTQSELVLKGLDKNDIQADKKLIEILQLMGADLTQKGDRLHIKGGNTLRGVTIDAADIPDLLPTLAVIGTQAEGRTIITNVAHARIKETDRIHSMAECLRLLGAKIEENEDGLIIYKSDLKGGKVSGFGDHRTVMALSIAGLIAQGKTQIEDAEAVNKTFPQFVALMKKIGARMDCEKL